MSDQIPNILVIDDTPANLKLLGSALASEFRLQIATSGAMGLALAEKSPPDLILLDVMMPEMDGYETCQRLKAAPHLKTIPVIFVTALTEASAETAGLALGAADYITKPINFAIARQRILNLLEREQLRKRVELHRDCLETLVEERSAELMEQTTQLDAIFSLSPDGFVSFGQNIRVKHVNSAFTRMAGLAGDRLIGLDPEAFMLKLLDLCVASPRLLDVNDWFRGLASGNAGEADPLCLELSVPAGRTLEVRRQQNPGKALSQVLYFHDISQLMEVDRMKSEFLSLAAHELRTPMASIYGFSEALLDQELDEETRHEVTTTIHRQAQVMSSIIDDLVDLAGIEARQGRDFAIERISLSDVLSDAFLAEVCPADRIRPLIHCLNEALHVCADRKRLGEAIAHLLANAYAYSLADSEVSIGFRIKQNGDGRMFGIAVKDCGLGMSPEQRQRCCERFYRADTSGQTPGTGLGMSIVKEIIDIHGGQIDIDSAVGQGTMVTLWLPEATAPAPGNKPLAATPALLNQTALLDTEGALALMDGNTVTLLMLLPIVREQMSTDRREIAEAVRTGDTVRIKVVSHRLKGSVGYIGAMSAHGACERLESGAEHADAATLAELHQQLENEIDALTPAIANYIAAQSAAPRGPLTFRSTEA